MRIVSSRGRASIPSKFCVRQFILPKSAQRDQRRGSVGGYGSMSQFLGNPTAVPLRRGLAEMNAAEIIALSALRAEKWPFYIGLF